MISVKNVTYDNSSVFDSSKCSHASMTPIKIDVDGTEIYRYLSSTILDTYTADERSIVKEYLECKTLCFNPHQPMCSEIAECVASIGLFYYSNDSDKKENLPLASLYWSLAAKLGHAIAMNNLGCLYERGDGIEQDINLAVYWFNKGGDLGYLPSFFNLGRLYEQGIYIKQDFTLAFGYYKMASEGGYKLASHKVAVMYLDGRGVEKDFEAALELLTKSGLVQSYYTLGVTYAQGNGVDQDYAKAYDYFLTASEMGCRKSMHELGVIFHYGRGIPQNPKKAVEFFKKAGIKSSYDYLSEIYRNGDGVEQNLALADHYSRLATRA